MFNFYLFAQLVRELMSKIDTLHVTPGALSLYRLDLIKRLGGFDENSLTEDYEIAMRLRYHGYTIKMAIKSISYTAVPDTFRGLWKQRVRWFRGFIETAVKYKKMFGNKVYELVVANTKDKSPKDWSSQYDDLIAKTAAYGEDALIVKAADILDNFVCVFQVDHAPGKEKMIYLAKQIFKYINSNSGIFNELQQTYNYWVNKL